MTLNDLERRNSPYFAFFNGIQQIFRPIISQWLKIVRKSLSPTSSVLLLAKTITHPAAWPLCDSWASCYNFRQTATEYKYFIHRRIRWSCRVKAYSCTCIFLYALNAHFVNASTHYCPPTHIKGRAAVLLHSVTPASALQERHDASPALQRSVETLHRTNRTNPTNRP